MGVTHECDHPPAIVAGCERVTTSEINPHTMSQVRSKQSPYFALFFFSKRSRGMKEQAGYTYTNIKHAIRACDGEERELRVYHASMCHVIVQKFKSYALGMQQARLTGLYFLSYITRATRSRVR